MAGVERCLTGDGIVGLLGAPFLMPTLADWIQAARPKTPGAAVAPVAGSVSGWQWGERAFDWTLRWFMLGSRGLLAWEIAQPT